MNQIGFITPGSEASPTAGTNDMLSVAARACMHVFAGTRVFLAYAHGSRVDSCARHDSDFDIGYYLTGDRPPPLPLAEEMVLADRLSRRLGVEVDLRNLGQAPLEWRARVLERGCRLYCSDETARVTLEREQMVRWFDERPRLEQFHATRLASFAATGLHAGPCR
jgi:predicted nucleotidyltransferase